MIRKRVHRYFLSKQSEGQSLLRAIMRHKSGGWINRYNDWFLGRWPDEDDDLSYRGYLHIYKGDGPWALVPVTMFIGWLDDWRITWRTRPWGDA